MNLYVVSSKIPTAGEPLLWRTAAGMAGRPQSPRELYPVSEDDMVWARAAGEGGVHRGQVLRKTARHMWKKMKETAAGGP